MTLEKLHKRAVHGVRWNEPGANAWWHWSTRDLVHVEGRDDVLEMRRMRRYCRS